MRASNINHADSAVRSSALRRRSIGVALTEEAPHKCGTPNKRTAAFATVLSLLIVALLVVVLVGAAMLLRVETFTSSNAQKIAGARQNAIYGMEMAIADLQELAGPDQRVTATAELNRNATDPVWIPAYLPGGTATNAPTTPAKNWTGVWDVSKTRYLPDTTTPGRVLSNVGNGTTQVSPEPLNWFVSGGRKKSGGTESQTNNITPINYPARMDASGTITGVTTPEDHVVLLGAGSVDLTDGTNPTDDGVVVPKMPVFDPASPQPANPSGSYAFWVGDEGVKAKFQAGAETEAFTDTYTGSARDLLRLSAPQKLGIGAVTGNGTGTLLDDGYDPSDADFLSALRRLSADTQIGYLPDGDKLGADFKRRFHDLTLHSQGVLSDVKKGGLKQDLSVYLQQGNIAGKISDTDLLYEDARDDSSSVDPTNPRAPFRSRYPGFHPTSNTGLPRIGLLRSWYNLTTPTVRPQTDTQHGMFPVITRCEWPAWLKLKFNLTGATYPPPPPSPAPPLTPNQIPNSSFELRIYPIVTLYNPYNVDLPAQDYIVEIPIGTGVTFKIKPVPPKTIGTNVEFDVNAAIGGDTIYLHIPASEGPIPAGMSKMYTRDMGTFATPPPVTPRPYSNPLKMANDYSTVSPGFDVQWNNAAKNPPANSHNPNGYFSIQAQDPTLGNIRVDSNTPPLTMDLEFSGLPEKEVNLYAASTPASATPATRIHSISHKPSNQRWFGSATSLSLAGINYSGPNPALGSRLYDEIEVDTRQPAGVFQRRPLVHYNTFSGGNLTGGSLCPLLQFNPRASKDQLAPAIWSTTSSSASSAVRFWGQWRCYPDNDNSILTYAYSPPLFDGASMSEYFPYTYEDPVARYPASPVLEETSTLFSKSTFGSVQPFYPLRLTGVESISLADFQHVDISGVAWHPGNIFGNSWVPFNLLGRDCYAGFYSYTAGGPSTSYFKILAITNPTGDTENRVYDSSFMANEALWDRFFLSGSETSSALSADLLANRDSLPNGRLQFRKSNGANYSSLASASDKYDRGAAFLINDGAFNINSASIEAWKAILSSRLGLKINNVTANEEEAVFARMLNPGVGNGTFFEPPSNQPSGELAGAYTGARTLSANEVQVLAEEIVKQVKQRGPFTSVSDFVNRRLTTEISGPPFNETDTSRTGFMGALQAAIDEASDRLRLSGTGGINSRFYDSGVRGSYFEPEKIQVLPGGNVGQITDVDVSDSNLRGAVVPRLAMLGRDWYYSAAGVPGFITQADILQAIGPLLTARSDTFRIRSYGEVKNPRTGKIESRAWCEAIVQRVPDPMKANPSADDTIWPERPAASSNPANAAGRKFKILAFRWLTPEEV